MLDESIVVLSGGDILKRDEILYNYTYEESIPYLKYKLKDISFRDGIRYFIGIKDDDVNDRIFQKEFCTVCKKSGKANCESCSKVFEVKHDRK